MNIIKLALLLCIMYGCKNEPLPTYQAKQYVLSSEEIKNFLAQNVYAKKVEVKGRKPAIVARKIKALNDKVLIKKTYAMQKDTISVIDYYYIGRASFENLKTSLSNINDLKKGRDCRPIWIEQVKQMPQSSKSSSSNNSGVPNNTTAVVTQAAAQLSNNL